MTNYDGGTTLSVKTAIKLLISMEKANGGIFTQNEKIALSMAISALEKEKEPAPQEAVTSSSKNSSFNNDNTRLKDCQEDIDVIKKLFDVNSFLSGKTNVWCTLTSPQSLKYGRLVCVIDLFKEAKK